MATLGGKTRKGIRNQAHGSPANILDLYAVSDVPEIEGRDLVSIKAAPSVAHTEGKKLSSSESATWLNEHFQSNLGDVRKRLIFSFGGCESLFFIMVLVLVHRMLLGRDGYFMRQSIFIRIIRFGRILNI